MAYILPCFLADIGASNSYSQPSYIPVQFLSLMSMHPKWPRVPFCKMVRCFSECWSLRFHEKSCNYFSVQNDLQQHWLCKHIFNLSLGWQEFGQPGKKSFAYGKLILLKHPFTLVFFKRVFWMQRHILLLSLPFPVHYKLFINEAGRIWLHAIDHDIVLTTVI